MKHFLLLLFIGSTSFFFGQAPDGNPSTFTAIGNGNWNSVGTWTEDVPLTDGDGIPDGDDYVIIENKNVTVTANAGFGHLEFSASGNNEPILTINSGISLVGYPDEEDGAITFAASGGKVFAGTKTLTCNIEGTVTCLWLTMETTTTLGNIVCNLENGGTLTIDDDLTLICDGADTDVMLDAGTTTGTSNVLNLGGSLIGADGIDGVIDMGTAGKSTFNFNGTAPQIIVMGDPSDLRYSDIKVSNTSNATLGSNVSTTNVTGGIAVSVGAVFDDNALSNVFIGDIVNSGTINAAGTIDLSGDFTNSGTFTSAGCDINISGDWNNTGTYTYFSGDNVTFDGAGTSTITGATDWYELTADKIGLTVTSGAQNIHGILDLDQGTFTSGGLVTLISDATSTGQMDNTDGATFSGDLTVQRRIAKTGQSWSSITSPVEGTTLANWQGNGVLFSGFPTSDFPTFPFVNCFEYDEPSHGSDKDDGWDEANGMTDATGPDNNYRAHYVYMDAATFNLSVTGAPIIDAVTVPLNFTSSGVAAQDGWNLIGNPYPCTIDFDEIYSSNSGNIIDGYLVYSGEYGNYGWYDGATTGTGVGSGGATKDIPHSQGIWLQSINGTDLSVTEAHKVASSDPTFLKSADPEFMRIHLTGNVNTFQDEALVFSHQSYSDNYDGDDLIKFTTMNPDNAPTLFTRSLDGVDLSFNKIGINSISIPVMAIAGTIAQGDYTLSFEIPSEFMLGACISLEDLHTGITTDLRADTSYTYATSDTTTLPRFIIHIVKDFNTQVLDYTCFGTSDGTVTIDGSGITGSTFELLDGSGIAVFNGSAANDSIEFTNVPAGEYELATNHVGSCSTGNFPISVIEPAQVIANFDLAEDTVYLVQGGLLEVNNLSSATNYSWDFGDGNMSIEENPTHIYTASGVYQVMLLADNDNVGQCTEVTSRNVVVMNGPLSIIAMQLEENTNAFVNNGKVVVDFDLENNSNVEVTLVDVNGKRIISNDFSVANDRIVLINTDEVANGVYFVNITIEGKRKSQKLFID
ncbi:PKD domain-containing protein [Flavobacteriales bacterium]|nr:PKD domain-containing protein [Flavobacteriales bacterium]